MAVRCLTLEAAPTRARRRSFSKAAVAACSGDDGQRTGGEPGVGLDDEELQRVDTLLMPKRVVTAFVVPPPVHRTLLW